MVPDSNNEYTPEAILHQILRTKHNITIQNVRARIGISVNEITGQPANEGTTNNKPTPTPHIHIAPTIPYLLNEIQTCEHHREVYNLQTNNKQMSPQTRTTNCKIQIQICRQMSV